MGVQGNLGIFMQKLPFSLPIALTPKKTLLIGAGTVAWQKFKVLQDARWEVYVWAREIRCERFYDIFKSDKFSTKIITIDEKADFLHNFEVIIDASGDENLGIFLHSKRKDCGFLLNVVDNPKLCDFYFGAIERRENVSVMVSTNGTSPILSQILRDKIARILPKTLESLSIALKNKRKIAIPKHKIDKENISKLCQKSLGKVFIIGCGPGDFHLLTLKAIETFALLDVALIDNLVGSDIMKHLDSIEIIDVGKKKGASKFTQEQINELMLSYAKQGKIVGRLKGGDPVIFGRVWEEASFLQKHNIEVEYISGITSSLCGALYSGITPTLRGVSSGVLIVSAHLKENIFHTDWLKWLKNSSYTLIVLMAHSFASRILDEAKMQNIDLNLPAAFISKVSLESQKSIIGTLKDLPKMAQLCENPSILIIGKAVEKSLEMPYFGERIIL